MFIIVVRNAINRTISEGGLAHGAGHHGRGDLVRPKRAVGIAGAAGGTEDVITGCVY